jgi:hypothetical protein
MGSLPDADQVTDLTGICGDTVKIYLKLEEELFLPIRWWRAPLQGCVFHQQ